MDGNAVSFVIQTDVAPRYRDLERPTGLGNAVDRLAKLPHDVGTLRVAEVQAVGCTNRQRSGARDVAC